MKKETKLKKSLLELAQRIADGGTIDEDTVGELFDTVFALKAERDKSPPVLSKSLISNPVISSRQISGSSSTTNRTSVGTEEEKGRPVVYIRVKHRSGMGYEWFSLKHNDYVSSQPPVCKCGAVEYITSSDFSQLNQLLSSVAAVNSFIYVFGGYYEDDNGDLVDSDEVSYIDTSRTSDGWKVCKNKMPKGQNSSYPITLDDERVLLVGGLNAVDPPFAQMFNHNDKKWVALENYPDTPPNCLGLSGHAIVKEGGDTMVLMHECDEPCLYTYNVSTDSWGTRWVDKFREKYHSGVLLHGIYYVLDVVSSYGPERVVLSGYEVSSQQANCLPVKIIVENDGKKWVPRPGYDDRLPWATLLKCGDNKLGMIWSDPCSHAASLWRSSYHWSIFEIMEDRTNGVLRLAAHPLSHVCYHVDCDASFLDKLVPVCHRVAFQRHEMPL